MPEPTPLSMPAPALISAPWHRFRDGVRRAAGYDLEEREDRILLRFSPWFTESAHPHQEPCLRLEFRREGDRAVLERFIIEEVEGTRHLDIEAGRDALQAWMNCICD